MQIMINGAAYKPVQTPVGAVVIIPGLDGPTARVRVAGENPPIIRPLALGLTAVPDAEGGYVFDAPIPSRISVEFTPDGADPIFLFFIAPSERPQSSAGQLTVFESGIHDVGEIQMSSGDTLYLAAGAVVRGWVCAENASNITVCGPGMFDVTGLPLRKQGRRVMTLQSCRDITLRDFTVIGSETWNIVPAACQNVVISGVNILSWIMTGDGIDLCGCEHVLVEGCFVRAADDCVAIKAVGYGNTNGCKDIRHITVRRCVFWNDQPGNAMEIGYETRADEICDILFEDIDVIHCMREGWQSGGVFTIHNGDRAKIHDIIYRNIRVEDAREKLIDFKVLFARYSKDAERGEIHNIRMEDIAITDGAFPPSIMRGWEEGPRLVGPVTIRNLTYRGERVKGLLDARIVAEMCKDITVE